MKKAKKIIALICLAALSGFAILGCTPEDNIITLLPQEDVVSIFVHTGPAKTVYDITDEFEPEGMEVRGITGDGFVVPIPFNELDIVYNFVEPTHSSVQAGFATIFIKWNELETSFQVDIGNEALVRAATPFVEINGLRLADSGIYAVPNGSQIFFKAEMPGATEDVRFIFTNGSFWPSVQATGERGDRVQEVTHITWDAEDGLWSSYLWAAPANNASQPGVSVTAWSDLSSFETETNTGGYQIRLMSWAKGFSQSALYRVTLVKPGTEGAINVPAAPAP